MKVDTNKVPNFFMIGFPKCGTTTLWHELQNHPNIFMSWKKEPNFFNKNFEEGWEWYYSLFDKVKTQKAIGEASTSYAQIYLYPEVPQRIFKNFPQARLIFIVRHPIGRMVSSWKQHVVKGRLPSSKFNNSVRRFLPIVRSSKYFENLQGYRSYFNDEQIHIIFLEDLIKRREQVLNQCFRFLNVEPLASNLKINKPRNVSADKRIDTAAFKILRDLTFVNKSKKLVPGFIKKAMQNYLHQPIPAPEWNEKTLSWAISEVKEDAKHLLNYADKPANYWQFSDSAISSVTQ